jgi:antitoxin component HigA of HigAB toxin-antitoxin module
MRAREHSMQIRPIRGEEDYKATLREISALVDRDPQPGSPDGDRLESAESSHDPRVASPIGHPG